MTGRLKERMTDSITMKIVVPVYNAEKWIERCLTSVAAQLFCNWECVIINDASTDRTGEVIDSLFFVKNDERFTVVHNDTNVKALENIINGFNILKSKDSPDSILLVVDGDDFLFSEYALKIIEHVYVQDPSLLLTFGNWIGYPDGTTSNCKPYDSNVVDGNEYRSVPFVASHPRTFKSKLWYSIKDSDLRDDDGEYFKAGWDVAFMIPMLEMAQERHAFVDHILYCYNRINPLSDFRVHEKAQLSAVAVVTNRKKYDRF